MTAVIIGEAVPRFDLVMGLLGGALTGPLMFILPPIIHYRLRSILWRKQLIARLEKYQTDPGVILRGELLRKTTLPPHQLTYSPNAFGLVTNEMAESGDFETPSSTDSQPPSLRLPAEDDFSFPPPATLFDPPPRAPRSLGRQLLALVSTEVDDVVTNLSFFELCFTFVIVGAGIMATLVATYYALVGNIAYANFAPPCIVNVNEASRVILDEFIS